MTDNTNISTDLQRVDILEFSDFLITYFTELGAPISHLKLQKLLYYVQAWHLVHTDDCLFEDVPEAWTNGPVYRTVYDKYKVFKDGELTPSGEDNFTKKIDKFNLTEVQQAVINSVLHSYGKMSPLRLVHKTHSENPWMDARGDLSAFALCETQISLDVIKNYYSARIPKG